MENVEKQIKAWCKDNKLKLHKITETGFIASKLSEVKAGMKVDSCTGNITDYEIKTRFKRRVFFDMIVYVYDNYIDVSFGKQYKNEHPAFSQFVNENVNDNVYAFFNTKTNEIVGRGLTSDMIDYHLYKKNKIKDEYLKVIKNPSDDEVRITDSGSLVFKDGYKPHFLGYDY